MKKIRSKNYKQLEADQTVHPPVDREDGHSPIRGKKKKKIYQNGLWIDDLDISDFVE